MTVLHCNKQRSDGKFNKLLREKIFTAVLRERSRSYETLYFSFPEEFRVVPTPPNFYQNRVSLLNIKEALKKVPTINQSMKPLDFFLKKPGP